MPRGTRHNLTGLLLRDGRRFVLRVDDGGEWHLDSSRNLQGYLGQRVMITGLREDFNLLFVEKISPA